jgi:hypothetical protein
LEGLKALPIPYIKKKKEEASPYLHPHPVKPTRTDTTDTPAILPFTIDPTTLSGLTKVYDGQHPSNPR